LAEEDPAAGLPDPEAMARDLPDLDLDHPLELEPAAALEEAAACEAAALAVDPRLTGSEGATVSLQRSEVVLGDSRGWLGGYRASRKGLSCVVVAEAEGAKERDGWSSAARDPRRVEAPEAVGRTAGERAVRRLGGRPIATRTCPVCFEHDAAATLLGHLAAALSGGAQYRRTTFLEGAAGERLFPPWVTVRDEGRLPAGLGSAPFDAEGVATQDRSLVEGGAVTGYLLDSYAARRLGLATTGNAGGHHNLYLAPGEGDLAALLRRMDRGVLVTDLMGQGVNLVTGDYSRGAAGFWVEGGEIAHPVHEITLAANLRELFAGLVAAASDLRLDATCCSPSLLVERMTVAGR
ncbi:MAG: metalloprotease PmbA, partial [Nitrospirae bacterium]